MRLILLYLIIAAGIGGLFYGIPALKQFRVKHKRIVFFSVGMAFLLVTLIYFLEQI